MREPREIALEVRRWIEKAEHDLRNGEYVLTLEEDCPADTVCFHAQQCAEKYLKALLVWHGVDFPRTHDLVALLNHLPENHALKLQITLVQPLNRYSVESRYPGDWEPIEVDEAIDAIKMAQAVREAVKTALPQEILR